MVTGINGQPNWKIPRKVQTHKTRPNPRSRLLGRAPVKPLLSPAPPPPPVPAPARPQRKCLFLRFKSCSSLTGCPDPTSPRAPPHACGAKWPRPKERGVALKSAPGVAAAGHGPSFSYGAEGNAADPPQTVHHGPSFLHRAARDLVGRLTRQRARFAAIPHGMACFEAPAGDTWAARGEHHEHSARAQRPIWCRQAQAEFFGRS